MQGIALNFIPASSYQIMRGGTIATTFLFSIIYLKMRMERYHIIGVFLAILGIFVIGCTSLIY
jgi:drug/metabolite transporter (DMT)-like permease